MCRFGVTVHFRIVSYIPEYTQTRELTREPRIAARRAKRARRATPVVMSVSVVAPTEAMSVSIVRKVIFLSCFFLFLKTLGLAHPSGFSFRLLSCEWLLPPADKQKMTGRDKIVEYF